MQKTIDRLLVARNAQVLILRGGGIPFFLTR